MTIRDYLKYFYLKRLKILQNRDFMKLSKFSIGGSAYAVGIGLVYSQLAYSWDEAKNRVQGQDSILSAATKANVSGFGENVLARNKSLQGRNHRKTPTKLFFHTKTQEKTTRFSV